MRTKTLIITGSGGWLGKNLIEILHLKLKEFKFEKIIVCSKDKGNLDLSKIKNILSPYKIKLSFLFQDISTISFYEKINNIISKENDDLYIIYAASVIHARNKKEFLDINLRALVKFIKFIKDYSLNKIVYISSNSPHGFSKYHRFDEQSKYNPIGYYGVSKMKAEIFLLENVNHHKLNIIKTPWFHGLNMPDRQKLFIKNVSKNLFPFIIPGKNKRSLINARDLAIASFNLLLNRTKYCCYWVCEKQSISIDQYIKLIKNSAFKNGFVKRKSLKINSFLLFPPLTSTLFCFFDQFIQFFGGYSSIIHVMGELGMNIEASPERYQIEFKNHKFYSITESIDEEVKEAFR